MKKFIIGAVLAVAAGSLTACGATQAEPVKVAETVPVVSEKCIAAIEAADDQIELEQEAFTLAGEAFRTGTGFDVSGMNRVQAKLEVLQPKLMAARSSYVKARLACLAES
jgi:predicted small secreted protein